MLRERLSPPSEMFPRNPWALEAAQLDRKLAEELVGQLETMFALSNGYLGLRGTWDEGVPSLEPGVFLNGFYEYRPINYGEHAYGFPRRGQTMLNCPDGSAIRLFIDDEPFVLTEAEVVSLHRTLDLKDGVVRRDVAWLTPAGHGVRLRTERLVSFTHRHLAAIRYELAAEDAPLDVVVSSELRQHAPLPVDTTDPRLAVGFARRVLRPAGSSHEGLRVVEIYTTESSRLTLGCGIDHVVEPAEDFKVETAVVENAAVVTMRGRLRPGQPFRLHKYLSYHYTDGDAVAQIRSQVGWTLNDAMQAGFTAILDRHREDVAKFWRHADVEIECEDPRIQQVVRWNLFQLLQATARCEGHGIGARGLTGQTYEGHYFWDMEIYVLPFLIYQVPRIARNILRFRYDALDKARARARELGHRGATFPWRTINGEEASAYYAAGTAQYHINADIAYALRKYVDVSGDIDFLLRCGAEILVETARFWLDLGFFSDRKDGRFCINGVTGPDEYTAIVNNNYFTNVMARENLRYAEETVRWMQAKHPEAFNELVLRTGLAESEAESWRRAADLMYLPYDERLRVHPQDDSFLDKEVWDFAGTPEENYPLMIHYHPLNLYRAQVIKQADTLLAMFLLSEQFSREEKKRNFDYYDPLTTHDSSLSVCIQSIIANEIGYSDKAMRYFRFAAVMDVSDVGGNMKHGAHIASIGGTWLALVYGFAGMRDNRGRISFRPYLPVSWRALRFCLVIRGARLYVAVEQDRTRYELKEGDSLSIRHMGEEIALTRAAPEACRRNAPRHEEPTASNRSDAGRNSADS